MNRFRSRKKSHGEGTSREGSRRPSMDNDVPALPSFAKSFKRKKQNIPEQKPQLDLSTVLPPSDDFRTSLLMPKLSARFSMLKEQDDPSSMLGKANDDSVIFPKRASRLDLFSSRPGLGDISEDDALRGPIRPPFLTTRTESYGSDGNTTDDGSMMSRSRPGEGNTMFGGRQKIYKIPVGAAGSVKNFGAQDDSEAVAGGNMGGKPIYESDITMSTFQKLREQERRDNEQSSHDLTYGRPSKEHDRSGSPPYVRYNRNRETSSSTNSAPSQSRVSTAATSVASQRSVYGAHENLHGTQPVPAASERSFIKSRRLYGQAMDRDNHDQQSSSLQRIGSFSRSRTPVGGTSHPLGQSRSATNLNDRYQRGGPLYASNGFRAESPIPSAANARMGDFDLGLNEEQQASDSKDTGYGRSSHLSSASPDLDPTNPDVTLLASLEPNDVGKATASGAFNKPKKQYDEHQYLQRQLQLQEGRNTPSPQPTRPFSPQISSLNGSTTAGRSRDNSLGSSFSRTNSFRRPWMEDRVQRGTPERGPTPTLHNHGDDPGHYSMERSFLSGLNSSNISSAQESECEMDSSSPILPPAEAEDADRLQASQSSDVESATEANVSQNQLVLPLDDAASGSWSHQSDTTVTQHPPKPSSNDPIDQPLNTDSPTLGPVHVPNGLSGLIRAHLRNDSGQSSTSNYPEDSPVYSRKAEIRESILGHSSALDSQDESNVDQPSGYLDDPTPPPLSFVARNFLEQATALKNMERGPPKHPGENDKIQRLLGGDAPQIQSQSGQRTPDARHNRDPSLETQKEREEMAQELAERRRIVQGKLQTFVESESRSASPAPVRRTHDNSPPRYGNGPAPLKKSSLGNLRSNQEKPTKAMRMLGIDKDSSFAQPPPALYNMREQLPDRALPPRSKGVPQPGQRPNVPQALNRALGPGWDTSRQMTHSIDTSNSSTASSENAKSRPSTRQQADVNGSSSAGIGNPPKPGSAGSRENSSPKNFSRSSPISPEPSQVKGGRSRSNSKPSTNVPFEQRSAPPGTPFMINPSGRPKTQQSSVPFPSDQHDPAMAGPRSPGMTASRQSPTRNFMRSGQPRKQSVNKHDISDPIFQFGTSTVDTVNLPPGASLRNGMDSPPSPIGAPPIPARDSRRKRTQTLLQALGRLEKSEPSPVLPSPTHDQYGSEDPYEERSTFSDDEPVQKPRYRQRKGSSEKDINSKARQQAIQNTSNAVATSPLSPPGKPPINHVQYQAKHDVPASAVMF